MKKKRRKISQPYDIIITEVKKRITNEIANNLKNFKKSVDKHKQA